MVFDQRSNLATPLFHGRLIFLRELHPVFEQHKWVALTGPVGVGKSQIAIQYCLRYAHEYQTITWIDARSIVNETVVSFPAHLPKGQTSLLVIDGVEDLFLISQRLQSYDQRVLLTMRGSATGALAHAIPVAPLSPQEGCAFLLRCVPSAREDDSIKATTVCQQVEGFPLLLDQVGAFISKHSFETYLALSQQEQMRIWDERGEQRDQSHPLSFLKSIKAICGQLTPLAGELVRLLCFVPHVPESIPSALKQHNRFRKLANPLIVDKVYAELFRQGLLVSPSYGHKRMPDVIARGVQETIPARRRSFYQEQARVCFVTEEP